jgi:HAD superfamily hydrolase (TIGR01509 family)
MKKKFRAVIFDCDGVLVDSEKLSCGIFAEMMREMGANVTDQEVLEKIKGSSIEFSFAFASKHIPTLNHEEFESAYRKRTFAAFQKKMQPVKGIPELLKELKLPRSVVSNGPSSKIILNLKVSNIIQFFDEQLIFSGYDLKRFKPDPYMLLLAATQMNVNPEDCLVIEDSKHGALAAAKAGMVCYGYSAMTDESELISANAIPFDDMEKIRTIIV